MTRNARSKRLRRIVLLIVVPVALLLVAVLLLTVATFLPTDAARLSAEHAPFSGRSGRRGGSAQGCGLNEVAAAGGACAPAKPFGVRHEQVRFRSTLKGSWLLELRGTLSLPQGLGPGRRPGAVLVHGSGPQTRDAPSPGDLVVRYKPRFAVLRALAELLSQQGLVVLRYDKRACARCYRPRRFNPRTFNFMDFAADARDAVTYLASRPEVDPRAIVLLGHSQGGQMVAFAAQDNPHVAAVVSLAGTTQTFEQGLIGQLARMEAIRLDQWDPLGALNVWVQRLTFQRCFDKLREDYDPDEMCLGGGVTQRALKTWEAQALRTTAVFRALRCPVLAIQGTVDRNIDPAVIRGLRRDLHDRDAEVHYVAGLDHALTNAVEPVTPRRFDPRVEGLLRRFLRSVKRPAAGGR